nr:FCD domain-containing protein [Pseudomaricurvus alkylphenolicus]
MSEEHLIDTNRIRTTLECMAVTESIENGDTDWEANMIAAFHRLASTSYLDPEDPSSTSTLWTTYHKEFHDSLVAACQSFWILRFRETLSDEMERFRNLSYGFTARKRSYAKAHSKKDADPFELDHKKILDAALARDSEKACKLIEKHFSKTVEIVLAEKSAFAEEALS